eukprot:7440-Rhodomonas_salina.2
MAVPGCPVKLTDGGVVVPVNCTDIGYCGVSVRENSGIFEAVALGVALPAFRLAFSTNKAPVYIMWYM